MPRYFGGGAGTTYTGTANQVIVTDTVLSTPQDIATTSTPQFGGLGIGVAGVAGSVTIGASGSLLFSGAGDHNLGSASVPITYSYYSFGVNFIRSGAVDVRMLSSGASGAPVNYVQWDSGFGGTAAVGQRVYSANLGYTDNAPITEAHTLAAAGTSTTATAVFPASSSSISAAFRITTEITGCTSVQVGVNGDPTRFGTFSTLTAGQTIAIGRVDNYTAQTGVLFTAVGGGAAFTAGAIRVNLRYHTASAPTS